MQFLASLKATQESLRDEWKADAFHCLVSNAAFSLRGTTVKIDFKLADIKLESSEAYLQNLGKKMIVEFQKLLIFYVPMLF